MTVVKKLKKASFISEKQASLVKREKKTISLEPNIPPDNLSSYNILVYGREGIGKTTLISMLGKVYFNMFEKNNSLVGLYMNYISEWEDFLDYKDDFLENHVSKFNGVSIDAPKIAYGLNMMYACKKHGITHPGEYKDFGSSWDKVNKEFTTPVRELMNCGLGFFVSCHSVVKKIKPDYTEEYSMIIPDLPSAVFNIFVKEFPNVFYYHYYHNKRWLQICGDSCIMAKNKMEGHFIALDGKPVFKIPMGNSKEEAYKNLMLAFNNKQPKSYQPVPIEEKISKLKKEG